jgi:hypothetical protein
MFNNLLERMKLASCNIMQPEIVVTETNDDRAAGEASPELLQCMFGVSGARKIARDHETIGPLINNPLPEQLKRLPFGCFQKVSVGSDEDLHGINVVSHKQADAANAAAPLVLMLEEDGKQRSSTAVLAQFQPHFELVEWLFLPSRLAQEIACQVFRNECGNR